jgi:manganese transport protein
LIEGSILMPAYIKTRINQAHDQDKNKTVKEARAAIAGKRKGIRAILPFIGPAFIASIAYIDPGNFATNIQAGSGFGYKMLWVVVIAT